tara:strand:+ start:2129 stop:3838 length:1710 start_codon:yes stop_codon:yes gene_type:complete
MPTFNITAPDGKKYKVSGDNAQGAHAALMKMLGEDVGVVEDVAKSLGSGLVRGGIGIAELPEMAARGVARAGQEVLQTVGLADKDYNIPIFDTGTGNLLRGATSLDDYEAQTRAGKVAGTVGEFVGGTGALGAAGKVARVAGKALSKPKPSGANVPANVGTPNVPALADDVAATARTGQQKIGDALQKGGAVAEDIGLGTGAIKTAVVGGVGSEVAGQMTEGTAAEPYARIVGALLAPTAYAVTANKTATLARRQAAQKNTIETAKAAQQKSYKEFDDVAGGAFVQMDDVIRDVERRVANDPDGTFMTYINFGSEAGDQYITKARQVLLKYTGQEMSLGQIDKLRQGLNKVYKDSGYNRGVAEIRDVVDNVIMTAPTVGPIGAGKLLKIARADFRRFKKIEAFEEAMDVAKRNIDARGTGGDTINGYKQAVKNILNNSNKRGQFDTPELEIMEQLVAGNFSENMLRLIGKIAPSGNGLSLILNLGAIYFNPAFLTATVAGYGAQRAGSALMQRNLKKVREAILENAKPNTKITDQEIRLALGLEGGQVFTDVEKDIESISASLRGASGQ